jgi:CO dehydrogenase maturation factor
VRHVIGALLEQDSTVTVVDMEAGLEHLSRGTGRHVDTLMVTLEPYYKSLETARRCAELGREIGIPRIVAVANKTRDAEDRAAIQEFAARHDLTVIGDIPMDDCLRKADLAGRAPIDEANSPAVAAIQTVALRLGYTA